MSSESNRSRGVVLTSRLLADKFTLGTRAHERLTALPVTVSGFTERSTLGLGSNTSGVADGRRADSLTLGAVILFTKGLGATNRASWLFAVNVTLGAREFFALHLALGACANGVADSRAGRIITLPFALWVAANRGLSSNSYCNENS